MATLQSIVRQRRLYIRELWNKLKSCDTTLESLQRTIYRIKSRRRDFPSTEDLTNLSNINVELVKQLTAFVALLEKGYIE